MAGVSGRGKVRRPSQGHSVPPHKASQSGGVPHKASQSEGVPSQSGAVQDNPFLKGLPASAKQVTSQPNPRPSDNPFLKGLSQPGDDTFDSAFPPIRSTTLPLSSAPAPSDHSSASEQLVNPFLGSRSFSSGAPHNKPSVAFDPNITTTNPQVLSKRRLPSYSEVAGAHAQSRPHNSTQQQYAESRPTQQQYAESRPHNSTQQQYAESRPHNSTQQQYAESRPHNSTQQQYAESRPHNSTQHLKTLHVKSIPDELNNSEILRTHFAQFGQVKLLKSFPAKKYATVEFASRVSSF